MISTGRLRSALADIGTRLNSAGARPGCDIAPEEITIALKAGTLPALLARELPDEDWSALGEEGVTDLLAALADRTSAEQAGAGRSGVHWLVALIIAVLHRSAWTSE